MVSLMLVLYSVYDLYYLVYFLLKIIIYITLKFMPIFLWVEKYTMNKFCHYEKFQFITIKKLKICEHSNLLRLRKST
jgi:hypothetical protein